MVYNYQQNEVRIVAINPSLAWHQVDGWLGCTFGGGLADNLQNFYKKVSLAVLTKTDEKILENKPISPTNEIETTISIPTSTDHIEQKKPTKLKKEQPLGFHNVDREPRHQATALTADKTSKVSCRGKLFSENGIEFRFSSLTHRVRVGDLIFCDKNFVLPFHASSSAKP